MPIAECAEKPDFMAFLDAREDPSRLERLGAGSWKPRSVASANRLIDIAGKRAHPRH